MKVSIIITTLNKHRLVQQRLFEIYKYLPRDQIEEIIISNDDKSSKELITTIDTYSTKIDAYPVVLIDTLHPTSFSANVNRGTDFASGDIFIVTQDDVMIMGNFLPKLKMTLEDEHCVSGRLLDFDTGWNNFHDCVVPYVEGWFIACHRGAWDDIGGMDENIKPYDAEDIDFAIKAKEKGYVLVNFDSDYLQHIRGQTIDLDSKRRRITEQNIRYVQEKWTKEKLEEIYND